MRKSTREAILAAVFAMACQEPESTAAGPDTEVQQVDGAATPSDAALPPEAAVNFETGACGTISSELGLAVNPLPRASTAGRLVEATDVEGGVALTVANDAGNTTYTLAGPYAGQRLAAALPPAADVRIGVSGDAFAVTATRCGWTPLFVASGAWEDLAPLIGSLGSEIPLDSCSSDAACPRDYGARVGGFMLRPGETAEDLRARAILGRLHGCIHSASGPSFYEAAAWPRADAPVCAAPARQGSTFALDVEYGATPPMDELIFQAGVEVQAGEGQLRIQPSEPGSPFVSLVLTGGGDRAFPVLAEPTSMRLHIESGSWSRAIALELRDAQGLALLAVRSSPHWTPEWTDGVRWNVEPATCLVPAGQDSLSPGMPQQGHRVTLVDGASSATWAEDTQVLNLAGVGYSMDVAAAHSWEATCADDDPGGLLDFLVMRQ